VSPVVFVGARFAAVGELDLFDTNESLRAERLHGPLSEDFAEYKLRMTESVRPDLLVLGSSRVMQLRATLFDRCSSGSCFYNAGGAATTMRSAQEFFDKVAASRAPPVLLLGLDIWQFNPNDATNSHEPVDLTPGFTERLRRSIGVVRQFTPQLENDGALRSVVAGFAAVPQGYRGARAILRGEGFRPDGSYAYGDKFITDISTQTPSQRSADAVERIAKSCCRLDHFVRADPRALLELQGLVALAQRRGTQVIAFTLPFSDEVMDAVDRDVALRAGFADVERELEDLFRRNGTEFVRISRLSDAGCAPTEMLDGFHPTEVCAARILARLLASANNTHSLAPFVEEGRLRVLIASRSSDLFLRLP
jgi:hypothetical protein